ncbi:MAG: chemotaxis protein [Desulfovibrio sp.]|nr:chemotaxis protein [Desulfovibrio sp.]
MNILRFIPTLAILGFLLQGCGPREIGGGASPETDDYGGVSAVDAMRYPITGAKPTDKMFYYMNKPDVMARVQEATKARYLQSMGISPEDPAYREVPRQKSPFRQ